MSSDSYSMSIPLFNGNCGQYYLVDGYKYDIHFPLAWALEHHSYKPYEDPSGNIFVNGSGPKDCSNCLHYGSINGVFVGYCGSCLKYVYNETRGNSFGCGFDVSSLCDKSMWKMYPYLDGISKSQIGNNDNNDNDNMDIDNRETIWDTDDSNINHNYCSNQAEYSGSQEEEESYCSEEEEEYRF